QERLVGELVPNLRHRRLESARRHREYPLMVLELLRPVTRGVHQISAAIRGAPIDRNETICPAHAFLAHSRKPDERDFAPKAFFFVGETTAKPEAAGRRNGRPQENE